MNFLILNSKVCCAHRTCVKNFVSAEYSKYSLRYYSQKIEKLYSDGDKAKILKIVNNCEPATLSRFNIAKTRVRNIVKHRDTNGHYMSLSDLELIDGLTERTANRFFDSILTLYGKRPSSSAESNLTELEPKTNDDSNNTLGTMYGDGEIKTCGKDEVEAESEKQIKRIKGQILTPVLTDRVRENAETVVSIHITSHCVGWSCIKPGQHQLEDWAAIDISVPVQKKLYMPDILETAFRCVSRVPAGSLYVLEAPPTSLRAAGGDPSNVQLLSVSLQRAQLTAAVCALLNARSGCRTQKLEAEGEKGDVLDQVVYYLRPALASRLYRTLVGGERISSEATVTALFSASDGLVVPPHLQSLFRRHCEREREVMGQCLLVNLAFMRLCFLKNAGKSTES